MVLTTAPDRARWAGRLRLAVLAAVALQSAHTAIFAAQYGLGDRFAAAMAGSGHEGWWGPASAIVLAAGLGLLLRAFGVLTRLERAARGGPRSEFPADGWAEPRFGPEVLAIWRRLLPLVLLLFAAQENIEHLLSHGQLLGIDALIGPGYTVAVPVLAIVTLAASAAGALVRWRVAVLRARVRTTTGLTSRNLADAAAAATWQIVGELAPRLWMSDRLDAGRAPPNLLRI